MTAVLEHPRWCQDRQHCATRGAHRGRLVIIRTADGDRAPITAQLVQGLAGDLSLPYVVITGDDGHVVCSLRQARALGFALGNAARQAGVRNDADRGRS